MARPAHDPRDLDSFVEAYESAQVRDGRANLADFLPDRDDTCFLPVLCELVRVELEYSWERGCPRRLEDYRAEYPELFRDAELVRKVAFEERRLREQAGEPPLPEDLHRPHMGTPADASRPAESDMEQAATAYRLFRRDPAGRDAEAPAATLGQSRAAEEYETLFRDLHDSDPRLAYRLARVVTEMPEVGSEFLGFRLTRELGRGAFGRVFLARQGGLADRPVALKISTELFDESRALAQLQHTNVVPIYSIHRSGPFQAVCMPYFGSTTLADVLRDLRSHETLPDSGKGLISTLDAQRPPGAGDLATVRDSRDPDGSAPRDHGPALAPRSTALLEMLQELGYVQAVLWMAARLADGLAHAHERGIVHRDLKPANILFTDEGQPMLLDFNLAADTKLRSSATAALVGGTLPYMAPEHLGALRGAPATVDGRSDLYSLGVILFELLTGRHPFPIRRGSTDELIPRMIADRQGPPPPLRPWNRAITPAVESIVRRCLEPDPGRRYRGARQLQEDLQRQLDSLPLKHSPEPSVAERASKWVRRHPRLISSSAIGVVAALALAATSAGFLARQQHYDRLAAESAFRATLRDSGQARALLYNPEPSPTRRAAGAALCAQALARYGLPEAAATWTSARLVRSLPAPERDELRRHVGDLLMLRADTLASREPGRQDGRRAEAIRHALALNERAESSYPPGEVPGALWRQRGALARLLGDEALARSADDRAARSLPRSPRDWTLLLVLDGSDRAALRDAQPALLTACRQAPQDYVNWVFLGLYEASRSRWREAANFFGLAIALRPKAPDPYVLRGQMALREQDYTPALADFDEAIRLDPGRADAYINRALARQGLQDPKGALADLAQALRLRPASIEAYINRAVVRLERRDPSGAIDDLTKALGLGSSLTRLYFLRARAHALAGDPEGARRDREEGLRHLPTDEESWVARGMARFAPDPKGALADFEEALKINPQYRAALQDKASVLSEKLGRTEEAVAVLDRVVELDPDYIPSRIGRGVLLARLGRRQAALSDAEESLRRDPKGADTIYRAACIYALTSRLNPADLPLAIRHLATALGMDPAWHPIARIDPDIDPIRQQPAFLDLAQAFGIVKASDRKP
jgi:serine/threonine protein kinase/tetratricopeptide (TPR) repeat protein